MALATAVLTRLQPGDAGPYTANGRTVTTSRPYARASTRATSSAASFATA